MTKISLEQNLVSADWLAEHIHADNLVILDASMKPVTPLGDGLSPKDVYIPGSLRFDFDSEIKDHSTDLPHMMPSPEFFTKAVQNLGINNDSVIVVYDNAGIYASPRAWWMFRAMGHEQVAVLNGGLPGWINSGFQTTSALQAPPDVKGNFVSNFKPNLFVDAKFVLSVLSNPGYGVVDARSEGRYLGVEPEPRPGLRQGHIPGAVSVPFSSVIENGMYKSPEMLREFFSKMNHKSLIFYCGSGVTACVSAFAAVQAGIENPSVYDGSWAEWGRVREDFPIST